MNMIFLLNERPKNVPKFNLFLKITAMLYVCKQVTHFDDNDDYIDRCI
jgi:hypothetical protein